jgi:putative flippase GtrA
LIHKLIAKLVNKKSFTIKNLFEILRFVIMGSIGALSYLFFSNLYDFLGAPTYLSPLYAWLSGLTIVYFGHMKFTYRVVAQHKTMFVRFLIIQLYNLIMSTFCTVAIHDWLNYSYFIASIAALVFTVPILYLAGKFWVYQTT